MPHSASMESSKEPARKALGYRDADWVGATSAETGLRANRRSVKPGNRRDATSSLPSSSFPPKAVPQSGSTSCTGDWAVKGTHIVTADVSGAAEHDRDHPNSVHRVSLVRHAWLRPESLAMYGKLFLKGLVLALTHRFEAVHAGRVLPEGLVGLAVARLTRRPLIVYAHGEEITTWRQPSKLRAMRWVYRHADLVIANSEFTAQELHKLGVQTRTARADQSGRRYRAISQGPSRRGPAPLGARATGPAADPLGRAAQPAQGIRSGHSCPRRFSPSEASTRSTRSSASARTITTSRRWRRSMASGTGVHLLGHVPKDGPAALVQRRRCVRDAEPRH